MFKQNAYELPMSRNYVAHWGLVEAVRELLQNALDSDSPFRCTYISNTLRIISENSDLPVRTLLLGTTSKANDETRIGSFGEGYKIAMLVLARLEIPTRIFNADKVWTSCFRESVVFQEEVLTILESKRETPYEDRLVFEINDVAESDYEEIKKTCLHLWTEEEVGPRIWTKYGDILTGHSGKIYVNGLYISDTTLDYSYDIQPHYITLERDRKTVATWEVQSITKNMWFETEDVDALAEMIERNCPDMYHADLGTPQLVKEACYKLFKKKHPNAVVARTQEELDKLVANGMTNVVMVNNTHYAVLNSHSSYANAVKLAVQTPLEIVSEWLRANRNYMRKEAIVNFKEIINKASGWKAK